MEEHEERHAALQEESEQMGPEGGKTKVNGGMVPANLFQEMLNMGRAGNPVGRFRRKRPMKKTSPWASVLMPVFGPVDAEEFLDAAIRGQHQVVEKYLCDNGNPNVCDKLGRTALHRASIHGHLAVVRSLLERGADVNCTDRLDSGPIHWACRGGLLEIVAVLKEHGVDLNSRDKLHSTPLHVATKTGHTDIVEYLLSCCVKINCRDREGDTALHDAVRLRRCAIVKLLLFAGADTHIRNHEGLTALEQVKQWHSDTMEILRSLEQPRRGGATGVGEQ